jgi:hypothetical protein
MASAEGVLQNVKWKELITIYEFPDGLNANFRDPEKISPRISKKIIELVDLRNI